MHRIEAHQNALWRLLGGIALGLCLAAGLWLLVLAGQLGHPHPSHQWVLEAQAHKQSRAEAISIPRLLVAGGSSAMFGIDSQQLEETFRRPAVNLGVNAGLGLPVILNHTLEVAKAGDVVIMALEYPLFGYNGEINHVMNDFYLGRPEALLDAWRLSREALPLHRWLPLLAREAFQIVMQTSPTRVMQGYRGLPDDFTVSGTYGAHRLDARGDQTGATRQLREPWMAQQVMAEAPRHYGTEHRRNAPGWALLRHFQARLHARGACLILVPPAFLFHPSYQEDSVEQRFYTTLPKQAAEHGLTYRGRPYDFMYPVEDMFNTDFHLVDEARQRNTRRLIKALTSPDNLSEPVIECPRPTIETGVTRQPLADQIAGLELDK
ncbi:MAG: hypothetical protein RI841_15285 [Halomonas sp.]|uniref:hypothetical protein n=1 Tax=Halomonas sp. TaxID=1486246 RepID=UPI00286FBB09|nr:hypothetical protein [Halomonas sp.]MDR9440842.1 hypothetical protein [Halomonas sp.]